ncbi:hypothetical protein [Streptomyces sp. NPDC021224]|uniref:hypothetical protein n=1 Tax=unclassified Streptomyces TaxID=2593676 RepID=UPI00379F5549
MDRYEGLATLEWWANRSTCLAGVPVRVVVSAGQDGWSCEATPEPPLVGEYQEGFDLLMAFDPVFTLRFDEESELYVDVVAGEGGRLVLTAYEAGAGSGEPAGI